MSTNLKISVAMATYNGAKYIEEQLQSFIDQSLLVDELIICDDGSTDNTIKIIKKFQETTPFNIKLLINDKRLGYGQNFGKALSLCGGDLIFISDQDDVWFPNKVEEIINIVEKNPDKYLFMNDTIITDGNLNSSGITKLQQIKAARNNTKSFVQGSCSAVRKEFLKLALPIPDIYKSHDNWLSELALALDLKCLYPEALQYYRIHGNNTGKLYLNTTEKIHFYHKIINRIKMKTLMTISQEFDDEQRKLYEIKERLSGADLIANNSYLNNSIISKTIDTISKNILAIRERKELHSKPRIRRISSALSMWFEGDYRNYFNGYYSFIRDIFFV